jgi:rhomboid-like protein
MVRPVLGASGALWGILALFAMAFPDAPMSFMFIPIAIPAQSLIGGLACIDVIGIVRGWQGFDHVAHLGGALAGSIWSYYGISYWNSTQRKLNEKRRK